MYKIIAPLFLVIFLASCGGDAPIDDETTEENVDSTETEITDYPPDTQSWYMTESTNAEGEDEKHLNIAISIMGVEDSIYIATINSDIEEIDPEEFWDSGISMNSVTAVYFQKDNIMAIERIKSKKDTYLVNIAFYETEYGTNDTETEVMVEQEGAKLIAEDGQITTDFHFSSFSPITHYEEADRYWLK
jgi:hypothetical protein